MITGTNELKTFKKYLSCKCKCKFDGRKCNWNQKWNNNKSHCNCKYLKEHHLCETSLIWNLATSCCKNGKYLASIIDDSVITCDEFLETTKTVPRKTALTKSTTTNFYILLYFFLITIALFIVVIFTVTC